MQLPEFLFVAFIALLGYGLYYAVSSESQARTTFHNQCVEAGGTPMRIANQGGVCLKDATQILLIKPV